MSTYIPEIKEEDMYVLIDRFGYTKSIDAATYSRTNEDALKEYPHIILMKNTDKLLLLVKARAEIRATIKTKTERSENNERLAK